DSTTHHGFFSEHATGSRENANAALSFLEYVLAMSIFRCWHIVLAFTIWAAIVQLLQEYSQIDIYIPNTLIKVVGGLLGFITGQRANASFERYNDGRTMWANIVNASRSFSRTVWFQVADTMPDSNMSPEEAKARSTVEKKTALNLIEAFAIATKHYLRGEDGIYYADLYHLVKFLPAYALPAGIVSKNDADQSLMVAPDDDETDDDTLAGDEGEHNKTKDVDEQGQDHDVEQGDTFVSRHEAVQDSRQTLSRSEELYLLPAHNPKGDLRQVFDVWPFSQIIEAFKSFRKRHTTPTAHKLAKMRARAMNEMTSKNLPFEITLYLGSYIAALIRRKNQDTPALNNMTNALQQLVASLTELERILTTPLPRSFSTHFWAVLVGWMIFIPFQIVDDMTWLTIPATAILAAIFFGFLTAGEEIESEYNYHPSSFNMEHFTQAVIHHEIRAITSSAPPNPYDFIFDESNNLAFALETRGATRVTPEEWVARGADEIQAALHKLS
ncbi:hypothetical protein FISHEDRAFT_48789, partial [Fistulina hepatica ATCC 64428]